MLSDDLHGSQLTGPAPAPRIRLARLLVLVETIIGIVSGGLKQWLEPASSFPCANAGAASKATDSDTKVAYVIARLVSPTVSRGSRTIWAR
jgi:hypothetical protein